MPAPAKQEGGDQQPGGESDPYAHAFERSTEPEARGEPEAGHPIGEDRDPHRHAGVLQSAQRAGCHRLHPVDQLEGGSDHQERNGEGDQRGIGRIPRIEIDRDQIFGHEHHRQRGGGHKGGRHADPGPASASHPARIARAVEIADPDRGSLPHAIGHLEGERGDLQSDRMRGQLGRVDPAHQEGGGAKDTRFGKDREHDRRSDGHDLLQPLPVGPPDEAEHVIAMEPGIEPNGDHIGCQHHERGDDGRDRRALQAERWRAQIAEHEGVIGEGVHADPGAGDRGCENRPPKRRDIGAQHLRKQHRHQRPQQHRHIAVGERDDGWLLSGSLHDRHQSGAYTHADDAHDHA